MKNSETKHEALVYSWAFALSIGFRELRKTTGVTFFKLCASYLWTGLFIWALCAAVLDVSRKSTDKPRTLVEITFLLGASAVILMLWK